MSSQIGICLAAAAIGISCIAPDAAAGGGGGAGVSARLSGSFGVRFHIITAAPGDAWRIRR